MKLKYRGVAYKSNPTEVTNVEGKAGGKYRGVPYRKGAVKLNDLKAETAVTHPEMLPEQPLVPKRPKVKH